MKTLEINKMEKIQASGLGQDLLSGIGCGMSIGAILTGVGSGIGYIGAVVSCGGLFGSF